MALPGSGTLTINDIVGEFGGSAPHSLSEYYRGGSLVPNSSLNSNIPTSGQIKISDFYGAANSIWTTTVTVGNVTQAGLLGTPCNGLVPTDVFGTIPAGSVSDSTVDFLSGATVRGLFYRQFLSSKLFIVEGNFSNTGFTTMDVAGTSYARTDATHSYDATLNQTLWQWTDLVDTFNPYGTVAGATKLVTFT